MRRIIKAELFRLRKSGILLYTMLVFTVISVISPFIIQSSVVTPGFDMYKCINLITDNSETVVVTAALLSLCVSGTFKGMMNSHETSCGCSIHKSIISRLVLYSVLTAGAYMIPGAVLCIYFRTKNDAGGISDISLLFNSLFLILNVVCSTVLITLLIRKRVVSAVVSVLVLIPGFVMESAAYAFAAEDPDVSFFLWKTGMLFAGFQSKQLPLLSLPDTDIASGSFLNKLMYSGSAIIICFAVVTAVLYCAVYFRYKSEQKK